jgi:diguanylate cyclase (GGDEF)-like protein
MQRPAPAPSIFILLLAIILPTVFITVAGSAAVDYFITKQRISSEMRERTSRSLHTLQQNISGLMEAYAINEYEKILANEIERPANCAVLVRDLNLGSILGEEAYITGRIRTADNRLVEFEADNSEHWQHLDRCYYSDSREILTVAGKPIGEVRLYASGAELDSKLAAIVKESLINTLIICALIVIILLLMTRRFILRHLNAIIATIGNTDKSGIPIHTVPSGGPMEVRTLAHSINTMITSIRESRLDLQAQKDALDHMAHHDALTGLANRSLFNDRLNHAIIQATRQHSKVAVLFVDLDRFKTINDSLGHNIGDKVLNIVTKRLGRSLRAEDTLARQGGDEFTILLEGLETAGQASEVARKILQTISRPLRVEQNELYISCSIGISLFPDHGQNASELLMQADAAMYQAKSEGRNDYQFFSHDLTQQALERLSLESQLRAGLLNAELVPYFQPQIDAASGRLIGFEALARWHHPEQGMISPARFIPLAESTGLIHQLDLVIIRQAMKQFAGWYSQGLSPGVLSVNMTVRHFQHQEFLETLHRLIEETHFRAEWLEIEVTESQLMTKPEAAIEVLQQVHQAGIRIALDDFGTGYSSLSYLKRLPITKLKIDQSFVRDLPHDEEDISITRAVIALAKSLGLEIIAEGTETAEQIEFLLEQGCSQMQGYFYARPLPAKDAEQFVLRYAGIARGA